MAATLQVLADDFRAARTQAYDLVLPLLSRWAFEYDMPIDIGWDEVKEIRTDTISWTVGIQGAVKQVQIPSGRIPSKPEWRILLASFREGLNLSNPLFKLLAFYKVIEGIKRMRIHRLRESLPPGQRKSIGMPDALTERFPIDPLEIVQRIVEERDLTVGGPVRGQQQSLGAKDQAMGRAVRSGHPLQNQTLSGLEAQRGASLLIPHRPIRSLICETLQTLAFTRETSEVGSGMGSPSSCNPIKCSVKAS